jgi:6-phosphogluconolactonase
MTSVQVAPTADTLSVSAAQEFARIAATAVESRGMCAVALAGGSTPRGLYRALAQTESLRAGVPWDRIQFFWGDERHVPPDSPESNYRMAFESLLSAVPVPPAQIHRVRAEEADAAAVARAYEDEVKAAVAPAANTPAFDLILLGLGPDGHTASLFPGTSALAARDRLVVENWVDRLGVYRITMTLRLLNAARIVMFVVSGEDKASIVRRVLRPTPPDHELPAQLVQPVGDLLWMLDRDAAGGLGEIAS